MQTPRTLDEDLFLARHELFTNPSITAYTVNDDGTCSNVEPETEVN